jgi:hypothetical protein
MYTVDYVTIKLLRPTEIERDTIYAHSSAK